MVCKCCPYVNVQKLQKQRRTATPSETGGTEGTRASLPSERPAEVQRIDVGGTALPGLTLETAKEHTRVSCGWPNARDACKARPTIEGGFGKAAPSQPSVATQAN